jgi:hypothetical protein
MREGSNNNPGPGRSTADRAFGDLVKQIAERNEKAHQVAKKQRSERDAKKLAERRRMDLR